MSISSRGQIIASCPAVWLPEHRRCDFALPIEGRFTGLDQVREDVVIIAGDSNSKRGEVMLDGATQLKMVRDYIAVSFIPPFDLDFSRDGNVKPYLGAGWSEAEEGLTWTVDGRSPKPRTFRDSSFPH